MKYRLSVIYLIISLLFGGHSHAFEVNVHEQISKNAIDSAKTTLNSYLSNIGLSKGIDESIGSKRVRVWIQDGSRQEDEPIYAGRYLRHFYNPLTSEGLKGMMSSYDWASDGGNEWSWRVARSRYYEGLTKTTDTERRVALADSFRSLGQVMHLVQDLASVAHVRNDAHPIYDGFEYYTNKNIDSLNYSAAAISIQATAVSPYAPRQFWDSDTYDGTNPSASLSQGLAEYTNANFASEDTITSFPYPRLTDMQYYEEPAGTWGSFYKYRKYYRKTGGGEQIEHFVNAGRLTKYLDAYTVLQTSTLGMDDKVYNDYAQKLIPRAVGYSTGLLNHFFRGKVNMEKDPQNAGKYIIKNESSEKMEGTFALYYDDASGNRNAVPGAGWTLSINPNSASSPVTFTEPVSPAPKEKGKYILVFNGKLGMEEGAIVGREVKLTIQEFRIKLTRGDGLLLTPSSLLSITSPTKVYSLGIIIYDSFNNEVTWGDYSLPPYVSTFRNGFSFDSSTNEWVLPLPENYVSPVNNSGFWISYYLNKGHLYTWYKGHYQWSEYDSSKTLIPPGSYEDTIPIWWTKTSFYPDYQRAKRITKTIYSSVPYVVKYSFSQARVVGKYNVNTNSYEENWYNGGKVRINGGSEIIVPGGITPQTDYLLIENREADISGTTLEIAWEDVPWLPGVGTVVNKSYGNISSDTE